MNANGICYRLYQARGGTGDDNLIRPHIATCVLLFEYLCKFADEMNGQLLLAQICSGLNDD